MSCVVDTETARVLMAQTLEKVAPGELEMTCELLAAKSAVFVDRLAAPSAGGPRCDYPSARVCFFVVLWGTRRFPRKMLEVCQVRGPELIELIELSDLN